MRVCSTFVQGDDAKELISYMRLSKLFSGNNKYNKTVIIGRDFWPKGNDDNEKMNQINKNSKEQTESIKQHVKNDLNCDAISENFEFINLPCPFIDNNQCFKLAINNLMKKLESHLNTQNDGTNTFKKLKTACSLFKFEPKIFEINDDTNELLYTVSKQKLKNEMDAEMEKIINREKTIINRKTPKDLREFNVGNYYKTQLKEFEILFKNKCENDFHQLTKFLQPVINEVSGQSKTYLENSLKNIVQEKLNSTIIYPKNIQELLIEQNIQNLTKGKEYELYYNKKPYKIIALDSEKITLPELSAVRDNIHDEENGNCKNEVKETNSVSTFYDPNSMEIKLDDNKLYYNKGSHKGGMRGFPPHRNTYVDDYHDQMRIFLSKNFEFDNLDGRNLNFSKKAYNYLIINVNHSNTLGTIGVDQSGSASITKISVKPRNN